MHFSSYSGLVARPSKACDAPPIADPADARRRYYELTPLGRDVLAAEIDRQRDLLGSFSIDPSRSAG